MWSKATLTTRCFWKALFIKCPPGNVGQLGSSCCSELPDINTEGQQNLTWSSGAVVGISTGFKGASWAQTQTLQSYCLLWALTGNGNQCSVGIRRVTALFFFFFPFSLFFFLIHQFLNEFRDISSDRWSALDMLLAPGHKPSLPEQNPARNLKKWRETSLHSLHVLFLAKSQFEVISFKHLKNALKCIKNSTVNFYGIASLCFEAMFQNGFGSASLLWLNISFSLKISLKYVRKSSFWLILPLEVAWTKGWETVLNRGKHCFQNFPHNTVSISLKSPLTLEEKKKNKYLTINSIF